MRRLLAMAALSWLMAAPAGATRLTVQVEDARGAQVADAVVTVVPLGGAAPAKPRRQTRNIDQHNLAFQPYVEVFRLGDEVVFHNSDPTRHHVYSFSPLKKFEMVLAPNADAPAQTLDKAGAIAVGCNIHDRMIAYLYVTDAPWAARTDARGSVQFDALPAGRYEVRAWHPRLKPGNPDLVVQPLTIAAQATQTGQRFRLTLLPDPRLQFDRERTQY